MRILVIEDEIKTAGYLKKGLTENGFIVDVAYDGQEGFHLASTGHYDLIILDVMLPKMDGWALLETLRSQHIQTPTLYLSAKDSTESRVKGLTLGADDYLVKPFAFSELLARIHSVLRRGQQKSSHLLQIADLEVDLVRHKAVRGGKRLDLTPKEFALLSLLLRRSGEVVSRAVIAEQVRDMNFDSDTNVVDVAVKRLRRKVDDPFELKIIHTIRGMGYVLEIRHTTSEE
jgi:two-component system copper resistance phosphate regulon response regulator CusR